ncbi:hypothetical protein CIB48_g11860, partial [Xylaria polymorpha]
MSFFNQLKEKAEELNKKHNLLPIGQNAHHQQQYYPGQQPHPTQPQGQWQQPPSGQWQSPPPPQGQQHWQQPAPPQPNYNTRPGGPPPIPSHSRPPATPSAESNGPKLGHGDPWGWGNNELENYTADSANSFYTHDSKLVLRAISQSHHPDPEARYTSARL